MKWVRLGPKIPLRSCSVDGMATAARVRFKGFVAGFGVGIWIWRLLLPRYPFLEIFRRLDDDANQHIGVLITAEHRAIAKINSERGGLYPPLGFVIWN